MVGIDGVLRNLRVQRPAADAEFCRAAVAAVQTWRFRPAQCDGEPYELQINVEVNF
jgi:TonB family protein